MPFLTGFLKNSDLFKRKSNIYPNLSIAHFLRVKPTHWEAEKIEHLNNLKIKMFLVEQ